MLKKMSTDNNVVLCECGCGKIVSEGKRFVHGHNSSNLGRIFSDEWKNNMSKSRKGHTVPPEIRKKISSTLTGKIHSKERNKKISIALKGKPKSEEHKKNMSLARKGKPLSDEWKKNISEGNKGRIVSPETRRKIGEAQKGKLVSLKTREKQRAAHKGKKLSDEHKKHVGESRIGSKHTEKTKKAISDGNKGEKNGCWSKIYTEEEKEKFRDLWKNPNYLAKQIAASHKRKNKTETWLEFFLNEHFPNEWKFVGDFTFMIGGKSPDFIYLKGKKLIIELWGNFWHKDDNPQDRIDVFTPFGYRTLIIWERELKHKFSLNIKIRKFVKGDKQ